jgi:hypothetical protein
MDDKLSININIADRMYPLRIDLQDCLAMATLQFVIQKFDNEKQTEYSPIIEELERMNDFLAEYIEKED